MGVVWNWDLQFEGLAVRQVGLEGMVRVVDLVGLCRDLVVLILVILDLADLGHMDLDLVDFGRMDLVGLGLVGLVDHEVGTAVLEEVP